MFSSFVDEIRFNSAMHQPRPQTFVILRAYVTSNPFCDYGIRTILNYGYKKEKRKIVIICFTGRHCLGPLLIQGPNVSIPEAGNDWFCWRELSSSKLGI